MRILYVEDNQSDVDLTRRYLARHAPEITLEHAATFGEAMQKLAECSQEVPRYDLALTDMRLPDGDGLKILAHIRGRALPIPVIVLTGTGNEELAVSALKGGAEDYIVKRHDYLTRLPTLFRNTLSRFRAAATRPMRPLRVLYAEHHAVDIDLTQRHLARHAPHIELAIAHSAGEVLQYLAGGEDAPAFDLLLLDYRLPGMNALDLLKELEYHDALQVPVVLVTGQGDEEVAVQALRLGISDYVVKNPGYLYQLPRTLENTYTQTLLQRERGALAESEARYRALFDLAPVIVFTKDTAGVYTSANTVMCDLAGRDIVGLTAAEVFGVAVADALNTHDRQVLEGGADLLFEERVVVRGEEHFYLARKSPLRDRRGHVVGLMGISLEITERLRAEAAQREDQRRLAQLVEHLDEVIWLCETQTRRLLYISPAYAQVWGHSVASAYADPASMGAAIIADDAEQAARFERALTQGEHTYLEFRITRANGAIAWLAVQTFPIEDEDGAIYRVAGVARDTTERRRTEEHLQQQERLVAVGQMAAGIAHDFNNILAIIMLYTQMLQISVPQATHQRHLATIYQQAIHAADLVQQILDFSRRSTMERVSMDIVPFIKELVRMWQRTLPETIRVELELHKKSLTISADPARLQQALMNMAINARDAMPDGGTLRLNATAFTVSTGQPPPVANMRSGKWLCLELSDTGTGIAPDVLPHIFDPFFTTKSPGLGTGLGLAQVYGIVHQLDGFIAVESQAGVGTRFTIYFPLVDQPVVALDETHAPPPRGQGETILLVEDQAALREAMTEMLTALGYQVLPAQNGRDAIALVGADETTIDLVVSDLVMPDMGGKELYQALAQHYPNTQTLRMLVVTGYPPDEIADWPTEHGVVKWLQKPFTMETFAHRVAETLHAEEAPSE